jgi:hypothetical protein
LLFQAEPVADQFRFCRLKGLTIWGDTLHDLGRRGSRDEETRFTIWGDDPKKSAWLIAEKEYFIGRPDFSKLYLDLVLNNSNRLLLLWMA